MRGGFLHEQTESEDQRFHVDRIIGSDSDHSDTGGDIVPRVRESAGIGKGVNLFVVSDVEMLAGKSRSVKYDYPVRIVRIANGGVARFADYRDIQGDDVIYTLRYNKSIRLDKDR